MLSDDIPNLFSCNCREREREEPEWAEGKRVVNERRNGEKCYFSDVTWLDIACNDDPPLSGSQARSWSPTPRLVETTQILYMPCCIISRTSKKPKGDLDLKIRN
jgi:hypothetical protein